MAAMGLEPGRHLLGKMQVEVLNSTAEAGEEEGNGASASSSSSSQSAKSGYRGLHAVLVDKDGKPSDTLAGAVVPLDKCLNNFITFTGAPLQEALAGVTVHPAAALGVGQGAPLGSLKKGAWADIVLLRRCGSSDAGNSRVEGGLGAKGRVSAQDLYTHVEVLQTWVGGTLGWTKGQQL